MKTLVCKSQTAQDLGLLIIRIGIGLVFMMHGWGKITGGVAAWQSLGSVMSIFGITFLHPVWGFAAAFSEFFGGIFLVVGLYTRVAAFFMASVMIVAFLMHWLKGDSFKIFSHSLSLFVVFFALIVMGSGEYSLDSLICKQLKKN